jgi:Rieske Fe-S protein
VRWREKLEQTQAIQEEVERVSRERVNDDQHPPVRRRTFLLAGVAATVSAWTARLWGQAAASLRFRPLSRAVVVPLADVGAAWRARPFIADALTLESAANPNEPIRINGMVVRTSESNPPQPDQFKAVCVVCPHEQCDVDFVRDPGTLPPDVLHEMGKAPASPVYICPCHNSTFSAENGERLAGPAPRGLYRFRVTSVSDSAIEIGEVEEDLLIFT